MYQTAANALNPSEHACRECRTESDGGLKSGRVACSRPDLQRPVCQTVFASCNKTVESGHGVLQGHCLLSDKVPRTTHACHHLISSVPRWSKSHGLQTSHAVLSPESKRQGENRYLRSYGQATPQSPPRAWPCCQYRKVNW